MIKINLLPYREKAKKENIKRQITIVVGILALLLVVLTGIQTYINMRIGTLEGEVKVAEEKLAVLSKQIGDIDKFKKDKRELEQKLAVINKLEGNRLAPVQLLDKMTALVPIKDMWLSKITEAGDNLTIEGIARNNMTVAGFMRNLEKASFINSVDLVSSKEKEINTNKLQQFVLSCSMKRGS